MYSFTGRVRYSETDSSEHLTLPAITDYFQDCGTFQSEELGLGVKFLQKSHIAWVLSAWQIVVEEYPKLCDEIRIGTFPYAFKGFLGYRNYVMEGSGGRRMAYANAIWVLLDMETMRPVRPTPEMKEKYVLSDPLPMEYAPRRIAGVCSGSWEKDFTAERWHLDSNHHVNNAQYVKMASHYLSEKAVVRQMRAEYKKQALLGALIRPNVRLEDTVCIVSLCDEKEEPYAVVEFTGENLR